MKKFETHHVKGETVAWKGIHQHYEVARRRYKTLTGYKLARRTVAAIRKRWKLIDRERENLVDEHGCFLLPVCATTRRESEWRDDYNVHQLLTCPEYLFQKYLAATKTEQKTVKKHSLSAPNTPRT